MKNIRSNLRVYFLFCFFLSIPISIVFLQTSKIYFAPHAQTSVQQQGKSGQLSTPVSNGLPLQPPPEGAVNKLIVSVDYDTARDTFVAASTLGKKGFIVGENLYKDDGDFDVTTYDLQGNEISKNVLTVYNQRNLDHASKMGQDDNVMGVTTQNSNSSAHGQSFSTVGTTSQASSPSNPLNSRDIFKGAPVNYTIEFPYDPRTNSVVVTPHKSSEKKATYKVSILPFDHQRILKEIEATTFNAYDSQRVLGISSDSDSTSKQQVLGANSKKIGILFVSSNYTKDTIQQFYDAVKAEKDKIANNKLLGKFKSRYEVTAVENYKDLGCKYWWHDVPDRATVLSCYEYKCDKEGKNCKWLRPPTAVSDIANQYRSDITIIVHNISDRNCRSTGSFSNGIIDYCSVDSTPDWFTINHELGHSLFGLRDEYVYGGAGNKDSYDKMNCTHVSDCSQWNHIQGMKCTRGCSHPDLYKGCGDGMCLMSNSFRNDEFGPVAEHIVMHGPGNMRERFGDVDPKEFIVEYDLLCPDQFGDHYRPTNFSVTPWSLVWPPNPATPNEILPKQYRPIPVSIISSEDENNIYTALKDEKGEFLELWDEPHDQRIRYGSIGNLPAHTVAYWDRNDLPAGRYRITFEGNWEMCQQR